MGHRTLVCGLAIVCLLRAAAPASASTIAYTDLLGREWRQVTETSGISWLELNSVCASGSCSADAGLYDLTGWSWASQDDVRGLFNEFIFGAIGSNPLGSTFNAPGTSLWASSFASYFALTYIEPGTNAGYVNGWASTAASLTDGFGPSLRDCQPSIIRTCLDRADVGDSYPKTEHFPDIAGAWLYRSEPAASVPEPATLLLLGAGLAARAVRRRRS